MMKERTVECIQYYNACDYCGDEITDSSSVILESTAGLPPKHFHSMHAGGQKGVVKCTCIELFEAEKDA